MKKMTLFRWRQISSGFGIILLIMAWCVITWHDTVTAVSTPDNKQSIASQTNNNGATDLFIPLLFNCAAFTNRMTITDTGSFAEADVYFHTPTSCSAPIPAESELTITGTTTLSTSDNLDIWILAYAPNQRFYPQSSDACNGEIIQIKPDGTWQVKGFLGSKGGDPEKFELIAIVTDKATSTVFSNKLEDDCHTQNYTGYSSAELATYNMTEKMFVVVQTID